MFKLISDVVGVNQSMISGANDIIAIQHEDGIKISEFRVRFGNDRVIKPRGKKVSIEINGNRIPTLMTLSKNGDAYFKYDVDSTENTNIKNEDKNILSDEEEEEGDVCPILISNCLKEILPIIDDTSKENETSNELIETQLLKKFFDNIISIKQYLNNPLEIINNKNVVCLYKYEIYSIKDIFPVAMTQFLYQNNKNQISKETFLFIERQLINCQTLFTFINQDIINTNCKLINNSNYADNIISNIIQTLQLKIETLLKSLKFKKPSKFLIPPKNVLQKFNLRKGKNQIVFFVERTNKEIFVSSYIYLFDKNVKFFISDIDGTVTKSDVIGMVFGSMGKDYTHQGIAKLYSHIANNGYQIMYVSSRAIGQNSMTRKYVENINQDNYRMPDGPFFLSPDGFFTSLKREVIDKEAKHLKLNILSKVKNLVTNYNINGENLNPFYSGFGNREGDAIAYRSMGIEMGRIFIINKKSEISQLNSKDKISYDSLIFKLDELFPKIN